MRRSSFQGNVHIINFPPWTAAADLAELFDDFGLVLGAQIKPIESEGGDLRLGIVALAPDSAADKAIEALQGHVIGGQKLKLRRAKPQPPRGEKKARPAKPQRPLEPANGNIAEAADYFPAAHAAPPRKVIVEYRGRRPRARV
ncbi:MAG TPA: RNA-binding protein [Alphaproteobacteria bacterium]|nr:RNA-binding protein [Alphaproteobacteria bacterium]